MDLVVRSVLANKEALKKLKEETQKQYEEILDPACVIFTLKTALFSGDMEVQVFQMARIRIVLLVKEIFHTSFPAEKCKFLTVITLHRAHPAQSMQL